MRTAGARTRNHTERGDSFAQVHSSHLIDTGTRRSCMVLNLRTVIGGANSKLATSDSRSKPTSRSAVAAARAAAGAAHRRQAWETGMHVEVSQARFVDGQRRQGIGVGRGRRLRCGVLCMCGGGAVPNLELKGCLFANARLIQTEKNERYVDVMSLPRDMSFGTPVFPPAPPFPHHNSTDEDCQPRNLGSHAHWPTEHRPFTASA